MVQKAPPKQKTNPGEGEQAFRRLFENHPLPMFVYDLKTLAFLEVNEAALAKYGYTREEFQALTIKDILLPEDVTRLPAGMKQKRPPLQHSGQWRHRLKDGYIIDVEITSHIIEFNGCKAALVMAHDISERVQVEEALRESEDRYRDLVENSQNLVCTHDLEGRVLSANPWASKVLGYEMNTILQMNMRDFLAPEMRGGFETYLAKIRKRGTAKGLLLIQTAAGERRIWEYNNTLRTEGVAVPVVRGMARDITERKQAEEAFRESEERYRSLFDRMLDGVYRSTHEGKFVDVNPAMVKMFGYSSKEEMLEVDIKNELYFVPEDRGSHVLDTGQEEMDIYRMRRKDGSEIWVEDHGSYIHDEQGRITYHEGMIRDITERKQAEEAVQNSEKRFRALIENGRDNISLLAADGALLWESPSTISTLGYAPNQFVGRNLFELIHPDDKDAARSMLVQITRKPGNSQDGVFRLLHGEGSWRWIEATATNLLHEPSVQAIVINYRDITERKRAEALREVLLEIMQGGVTTKDLQDFLGLVHRSIDKVIYAENFFVVLYNKDADWFEEIYSVDKFDPPGPPYRDGKSISAYVIRTGRPMLLNDEQVFSELVAQGEVELVGTNSLSWMGVPLKTSKETIGVMVVQDYDAPNRYSERDLELLTSIAGQVALVVERWRAEKALRKSHDRMLLVLDSIPADIYIADTNTYEILFMNQHMRNSFGDNLVGQLCWQVFRGAPGPCPHCTNDQLVDSQGNPTGIMIWEGQNPISKRWYSNYDRAIHWIGGNLARVQIAVDITERRRAEEALAASEAELRALFASMHDAVLVIDREGVYRKIAPTNPGLLVKPPEELLGKNLKDVFPAETADAFREAMQRVLDTKQNTQIEYELIIGGRTVWFQTTISPLNADSTLWVAHDITNRKQAEEALRTAEANYHSIFENATVGIYQSTLQGRFLSVNPVMARIFGYDSPEEMLTSIVSIEKQYYVDPADRHKFQRLLMEQGEVREFISLNRRKNGRHIWVRENARAAKDVNENILHYEGFITDITERKRAEEELRRAKDAFETANLELQQSLEREKLLACTDGLTGLFNRRHFFELAAHEFCAAVRYRHPLTFLMFDMDDFKQVNDTLGHTAGDKLLVIVAQAAVAQVRASDVVARYGGDEFIVMLPQTSAGQALPIAERISTSVAALRVDAFRDDKEPFAITLSIGIAEMRREPPDENVERVIQRADEMMYKAKQSGRNRIVIFGQDETGAT